MFTGSSVLIAMAAWAAAASAATTEEWKLRSIYQIMTDRFAVNDGSTDADCSDLSKFCHGTWKGLTAKLDYIQGMGFTAIQISPTAKNTEAETIVGEPYHGYWVTDDYAVNPHFGTEDDLKTLKTELEKRGMLLLVDVVVNNMAQPFNNTYPPSIDYTKFNPFNSEKYFHPYCNVTQWTNATNYQDCWLYPLGIALADLDTDSDSVVGMMQKWITQLVANYSIDGLRIDAAKHVNDAFLPQFIKAAGVWSLGEVLTGDVNDMCRYMTKNGTGLLPGMPNYLHFFKIRTALNGGSLWELATVRQEGIDKCNDTLALGTFVENHDQPRFASINSDMAIAKNAMTYVIMNDGIPLVYQGQEQHFRGAETPANREALWTSGYNTSAPLYQLTATLNKLRNQAINITTAYATTISDLAYVDDGHLCLAKGIAGKARTVFCINNKSSAGSNYTLSVGGFSQGDSVVEVLSCVSDTADANGNVTMQMYLGQPKVYALASQLHGTGLCETTIPINNSGFKTGNNHSGAPGVSADMTIALVAFLAAAAIFI